MLFVSIKLVRMETPYMDDTAERELIFPLFCLLFYEQSEICFLVLWFLNDLNFIFNRLYWEISLIPLNSFFKVSPLKTTMCVYIFTINFKKNLQRGTKLQQLLNATAKDPTSHHGKKLNIMYLGIKMRHKLKN